MIESIANRMAVGLKRRVPEHPASVEVLAYAFNFTLNTSLTIIIALTAATILNQFWESIIVMCSFALLRMVSGGYHFKSANACIIASALGANLIPFIHLPSDTILWINFICLALVLVFAPSRIEHQTRIPKKYFPLLKVISGGMVSANFIMMSPLVAVTFFVQSLSLISRRGGTVDEEKNHDV